MDKDTRISAMLKFQFGNQVFCSDGQAGGLAHVLCDATTKRLTYLAVKQRHLFGKTFYAPFASVTRADGEGIWLESTLADLAAFPSPSAENIVLDTRTVVEGAGSSGTLLLVAVHPESGVLAYLVAQNVPAGRSTLLRAPYVASIAQHRITLDINASLLKSFPPYRSDRELQTEVEAIAFDLGFLHIDLKAIRLRVLDSVLYMDGNISSTLRGELLQDQLSGVVGLLEIRNNLVGDDRLAADIALALGEDERTHDLPIGVYPQLGMVRLSGSARNAQQKTAASEIARAFSGVRAVLNDLVIDPAAKMLYVMSAPEGGEARDIVPGKFVRHTK